MFPISKYREDRDLGRCTLRVLAKRKLLRNANFRCFLRAKHIFFGKRRRCAAVLFSQVPKKCIDLNLNHLFILIFGTYSTFTQENNFLALDVCFPRPCSSAGRRFAAPRSRLQNYRRIVSFPQQKNRCNTL